jgi:hypothetical protein
VKLATASFSSLAALASLPACNMGLAWKEELPGGYDLVAVDVLEQMSIYSQRREGSYGGGVSECVYRIAWDERHILAAQHPPRRVHSLDIDPERTNYWVIEVVPGRVHGPLDADGFERERSELGVDPALALRQITEGLR